MQLPRDSENYVKAFDVSQMKEIEDFFDQHGLVVIKNVLNQREIQSSIDAIWNRPELESRGVRKNDPITWDRCWPKDGHIERKGWISSADTVFCLSAWCNRFHPNVVQTFTELWRHINGGQNIPLVVKLDRYTVMRPLIKPEFQTDQGWLHTDQNPKLEKDFCRVQGILTFTDSNDQGGGGFTCVPGFHKEWKAYCEKYPNDDDVCPIPQELENELNQRAEKIYARAGSLIIWDSRLVHANFPNNSPNKWRFGQYITFYPAHYDKGKRKRIRQEDAQAIITWLKNTHNLYLSPQQTQMLCG